MNLRSINPATPSPTVTNLRSLVLEATKPQLKPSERAVRARHAGEELADVRDLARLSGLLPGRILDQIAAYRGDVDAQARVIARDAIGEARAVAVSVPGDVPGAIANRGLVPGLATLDAGLPLIRQLADPGTSGSLPLIPAMPPTALVGDIMTPGVALGGSATITVADSVTPPRWSTAVVIAEIANQVFDFADDTSSKYLDEVVDDAVDRAAEQNIAAALIAAGTAGAVVDNNLSAALIAAECFAGSALAGPADLMIASPVDLPRVRLAVTDSFQVDPHPTLLCSAGVPAGKVIVTGRSAFTLVAQPIRGGVDRTDSDGDVSPDVRNIGSIARPRGWSLTVATFRDFILSVRLPAAVRVVTF